MRRAAALALLAALVAPLALPLVAAGRAAAEPAAEHHHPPGCPWKGTPQCPHGHHGPASEPAWSACTEVPVPVAGEARMAWAPPPVAGDPLRVRTRPDPPPVAGAPGSPEGPVRDVEIPPPQPPVA